MTLYTSVYANITDTAYLAHFYLQKSANDRTFCHFHEFSCFFMNLAPNPSKKFQYQTQYKNGRYNAKCEIFKTWFIRISNW